MKKNNVKRILSMILAMAMSLTLCVSAFAANMDYHTASIMCDGESVSIQYRTENGYLTFAKIGNDNVYVRGGVVYYNGEKIATLESTTEKIDGNSIGVDSIELYSTWLYTDKCPSGMKPSDYNKLYSIKSHNITFEKAIAKYSVGAIAAVLIAVVPFKAGINAEDVFRNVANMIFGLAIGDSQFGKSDTVYAKEMIYAGGIPYTRRNDFIYYSDRAKTNEIDRAYLYSSWA